MILEIFQYSVLIVVMVIGIMLLRQLYKENKEREQKREELREFYINKMHRAMEAAHNAAWHEIQTNDSYRSHNEPIILCYMGSIETIDDAIPKEGNVYVVTSVQNYAAFLKGKWRWLHVKEEYWNPITGESRIEYEFDMSEDQ